MAGPSEGITGQTGGNWYDAEQEARDAATGGVTGVTGTTGSTSSTSLLFPSWGTGRGDGSGIVFSYDTSTGTVNAEFNTIPTANAALLADPGNKSSALLNTTDGTVYTADTYADDYLRRINGTAEISRLRNIFIAKGWMNVEQAKESIAYGDITDPLLAQALSKAVTNISFKNIAIGKGGEDYLTLEEGLNQLPRVTGTTVDKNTTGTFTTIQPEVFTSKDYRKSVNDVYKEMTGRGATEEQLNKFVSMLNAADAKNPRKTVRTVSADGRNTTSVDSGGLTPDAQVSMLEEQALQDPDAENYTKATKFMDVFLSAIGEGSSLSGT